MSPALQKATPDRSYGIGVLGNMWLEDREMRQALSIRDMTQVFRLLQRYGITMRSIADLTQQTEPEVVEVLTGRRRLEAYNDLLRVANGLRIPRGSMGLDYDAATRQFLAADHQNPIGTVTWPIVDIFR